MSEKLYDEVIAPKLKEIAAMCEASGVPFVALCEYEPGLKARTEFMPEKASVDMHIAAFAARCDANVDALYISISRYCQRKGIDTGASMVMRQFAASMPSSREK